ncbi:hypothetical protein EON65_30385 [archaeon]|nr:MAG: hypothetical protein EON65_30385 [archaeon]
MYEKTIIYDGDDIDVDCKITTSNEGKPCTLTFTFDEDVTGPLYVYYELQNYYQNHRRYVSSVDYYQLNGEMVSETSLQSTCVENIKTNGQLLNPCGLIAGSFFTGELWCMWVE